MVGYAPYIYAYQATNIAITGSGTLDGNGSNRSSTWSRNETVDINRLREMGRTLAPVQQRIFGEGHSLRPPFIQLYSCSNVLVEGIGIEDFPFWGLHLLYSNDLTIRNISVCSLASNNDGIDVDSSQNVLIEKCIFQTKDDCIAIKSGRDADGRAVNRPSSDIVIRDCRMIHGGSSGVAIGSEMSGGIRGVYIIRCTMDAVSSMLTVKSNLDRGGRVEHIRAWNVRVGNCSHVLHVTTAYHSYSGGIFPPIIRDIAIDDVVCENTECAFDLMGSAEAPLHEIALQNIEIHRAVTPMRRAFTNSLLTRTVSINGRFS